MRRIVTLAAVIGVLVVLSIVGGVDAAPVDKSGLDVLCTCKGCTYVPPTNSVHRSVCIYPDGQIIQCDSDKGTCTSLSGGNVSGGGGGLRFELNNILANQQLVLGTLNSLKTAIDGIKADVAKTIKDVDGLQLACTTPDLVPLQPRCDGETTLHVPVYNQGGGAAGPSSTLVTFRTASGEKDVFAPTDPLAGFTGTDVVVAIPEGCFDIDAICKFQISVDAQIGSPVGAVAESNETNNVIPLGECFRVIP